MLLVFFAILAIADEIFAWDLLSDNLEKIATLFLSSIGITVGATFLMSLMINFSLISISIEKIAEKKTKSNAL
jgi:TRAP-type C4-dicarboxylate transport system permease small subunit